MVKNRETLSLSRVIPLTNWRECERELTDWIYMHSWGCGQPYESSGISVSAQPVKERGSDRVSSESKKGGNCTSCPVKSFAQMSKVKNVGKIVHCFEILDGNALT
ncbi:Uncharacterized protein Adt_41757 [Abeliophyllum distichum]|uniref:Uncharacterized protein n=1 Tax=Abeliophyllum distichum TaxID=126358 RepID=A0ABD1PPQ9_9LAMI